MVRVKSVLYRRLVCVYFVSILLILSSAYFSPLFAKNVTLRWDANREPDLGGYYLHYKTDPELPYYIGTGADQGDSPIKIPVDHPNHPNYIDPYDDPEFTLTGLEDDLNYFFALTAYNSEDLASDFSNEVAIVEIVSPQDNFGLGRDQGDYFHIAGNAPPGIIVDVYAVDAEGEKLLGTTMVEDDRSWRLDADFIASGVSEGMVGLLARSGELESAEVWGSYGVLGSSGGEGGSGCFIATAAYGSYFEPHVEILKAFRDQILLPNKYGHAFVVFYYRHSPPVADFIAEHVFLKALVRVTLMPFVVFGYVFLHSLLWPVLLFLISSGMVVGAALRCRFVQKNKDYLNLV
jgi:hypothetical protein